MALGPVMASVSRTPWRIRSAALAAILIAAPALAGDPVIDTAKSSIVATFKQEGVPVETPFTEFSGCIVYDPDDLATSSAKIEVITGSLDLGDETYNEEVRRPEWFDSATHPGARFQSTSIESAGAGAFKATGELTIKGVTQTITVPITVSRTAEGQAFNGTFEVSRKAFNLGEPMWDEVLEDIVVVHFHLVRQSGD